jgi:NTE family protein
LEAAAPEESPTSWEALDEMKIRPVAIAGTSMGAVVAGAYAAGIEGRAIRTHILRVLRNRSDVMSKLLKARVGRFADLVSAVAVIPCC